MGRGDDTHHTYEINDSEEELREIARWIYKTDQKMPWHISAFYPTYKLLDKPRTPVSIIDRAREIGLEEGLKVCLHR